MEPMELTPENGQRCNEAQSFYDWDCECDLPAGHEGAHSESGRYRRWDPTTGDEVPIVWCMTWEDAS